MEKTIYQKMADAGVEINSHYSDLYVPVNDVTIEIVEYYKYRKIVSVFRDQVSGKLSYDIPFAYDPYWNKKQNVG